LALLAADEPGPVETREGTGDYVVVCEHASNLLPRALGSLGLGAAELARHIAWDPGAAGVAAGIAARLDATLIRQTYSRLAIDCNRAPSAADAIATMSEDTLIPGNRDLSDAARAERIGEIWAPFHGAIAAELDARGARPTALITMHSFTPIYRGVARPWHVGIISTGDRRMADPMLDALEREPALVVGDNQPYSPKDNVDYTIRRHGLQRGLPHVMVEVRNDLLATPAGQREWTDRLVSAIVAFAVPAARERKRAAG
jgi:predicted N-formylglutamate amidohydrolase